MLGPENHNVLKSHEFFIGITNLTTIRGDMHTQSIEKWLHDHTFEQDKTKAGEIKTIIVIAITATTMVLEIIAGVIYGSMALLADGLHMGSHATALGVTAAAYIFARKRARDRSFSFGTGKDNALAGFTSAILLAVFSLWMGIESVARFFNPVEIVWSIYV